MSKSDTMFNKRDQRCTALPIQVITTGPLSAPSKCKSGRFNVPRVMKTKFPATVMVFGEVSSESHIMPPHIFEVGFSTPKCIWVCWRMWWSPGAIRWPVADSGCGSRTRRRPTSPKRPRLCFRRSATTLYPSLTAPSSPDLNPLDYFVWSYVENITNMTSHNTKATLIAAIRWVFAELLPALVEKACSQFRIRIEAVIET